MRYAIFTDVHANLEALEAVLARIDELTEQEHIDQIWFLGDLVGYGPNPNECIVKLRERTDVIIAGNHDWAAVGKIDLEDFSEAARISAEWTAQQLTEEHRAFLSNLPERLEIGECTLVHGSPYGPLWEYLTSEVLAERSFQYFSSRYCFVGHTHVPVIFQQPDSIANSPTLPLNDGGQGAIETAKLHLKGEQSEEVSGDDETAEVVAVHPGQQSSQSSQEGASAKQETASSPTEVQEQPKEPADDTDSASLPKSDAQTVSSPEEPESQEEQSVATKENEQSEPKAQEQTKDVVTAEDDILSAEERLNQEIEELLALLGLSQSMIKVTNEMVIPPEGEWQAPSDYRAIINPGGVGQPRDGDYRAAFMIYDTKNGFTFYRVPYPYEKTQEKIIQAGLPHYLATRLAYGR